MLVDGIHQSPCWSSVGAGDGLRERPGLGGLVGGQVTEQPICQCGRIMVETRPGVYECPIRTHELGHDSHVKHDDPKAVKP